MSEDRDDERLRLLEKLARAREAVDESVGKMALAAAPEPPPSGRVEVQGIVSVRSGEPLVQFRSFVEGEVVAEWQTGVDEARQIAQQVNEASFNAVYDAAIWKWARETWPDDPKMGARMLALVRDHRADAWGLSRGGAEDWR